MLFLFILGDRHGAVKAAFSGTARRVWFDDFESTKLVSKTVSGFSEARLDESREHTALLSLVGAVGASVQFWRWVSIGTHATLSY